MKLACVIHRFGADIAGGSEGHCRLVAEHLATAHDVTVVTTCARDHVTWGNHYAAGDSRVGPLHLKRFPTVRTRQLHRFRDISDQVFADRGSRQELEQWFRENGPETPALLEFLECHASDYDLVLFWSFRYYNAYFGLPRALRGGGRVVLVPTAEEDPLIHVDGLEPFFALPDGYVFLTPEEADLLGDRVPPDTAACVIGCGIDPPAGGADRRLLDALGLGDAFLLYLGRIDPNKGCETLLRHYLRWVGPGGRGPAAGLRDVPLVLAGPPNMAVPEHPMIRQLGFVDDSVREALLAHARVLLMPSPFESLSMVLLEAWNHGLPALVNAKCDVLRGQVLRADGGLHYRTALEFSSALDYLLDHPSTARQLGEQGRAYVDRHYRWPTVLATLEDLLNEVAKRPRPRLIGQPPPD
jgi:glycosyltransferase involved in cell wall biosynthesis